MPTTLVLLIGLIVTVGCRRTEPPVASTTTTTSARMLMNDDAAMRLAQARCAHATECDDVGAFRRFVNADSCLRELFVNSESAMGAEACPGGVNEQALALCMADLRTSPCDENRGMTLMKDVTSCRTGELCFER